MERPSCDDIVFWRETGMKEEEDEVEAREGALSIATDIAGAVGVGAILQCRARKC